MKKNIIILVSAMNLGGAQRVVSILCDHWSQNDFEITLISTFTGESPDHYKVNENVKLKFLRNNSLYPKNKIFNLISKLVQLRKIIKYKNPDTIISFLTRVNIATVLSTIGLKTSIIICERTWTPFATLSKNFYWMYRLLFRNIKKIIVQTDESKIWLNNYFPNIDTDVIPNPISYPLPLQKGQKLSPDEFVLEDRKIILACGRLHKYKQFDLLINAFFKIKDEYPDWDLIILGEGEERKNLDRLLKNLDIGNRVFLPGSAGNMSEWYQRAGLFVLSSSVEGFPNVLLEAMSYGLPCISFDCDTGPRDMIKHKINGILVQPEDSESGLIKALQVMIADESLRKKIALNAVLIRDQYSIDKIMMKWDKILGN
ncbi:glycosyltransferase family 4 protein [Gammaproteobacteria bacterium]|nr:glycosyltransferase family 4 protein [Gammaproteobacteria bacterium]